MRGRGSFGGTDSAALRRQRHSTAVDKVRAEERGGALKSTEAGIRGGDGGWGKWGEWNGDTECTIDGRRR